MIMKNQKKPVTIKKGGSLSHREYFYDESEEIPEDDDGLTPIRSHTYEAVEEE